jgi:predicted transcriptional regulator
MSQSSNSSESSGLTAAVALLGPLEGRIMRAVWTAAVPAPFVVRDVQALMPELAYTTVMTTLNRLVDKGLLSSEQVTGQRAHRYRPTGTPAQFLAQASRRQADQLVDRYGEAALAAFATRLDALTPEQRQRLRELAGS